MDHDFILEGDDIRPADPRYRGHDTDPMESATERDGATVPCATAGGDPPRDVGLMAEMLAKPRLALGKERGSSPLVLRPDSPSRDRHHDTSIRMDDDPDHAGTGRPAKRVWEGPTGQLGDRGSLGRHVSMMPSGGRHDPE